MTLNIIYVCGCEERVVDLGDNFFECLHCDRICDITDCVHCIMLDESDVEAYYNQQEEGDEDADI